MNRFAFLSQKYLKNNKKNFTYYIIIFIIQTFALLFMLCVLFSNFYYRNMIEKDFTNKCIEVNIGNYNKYEATLIFQKNKNIKNFYEINSIYDKSNELINTSYCIVLNDIMKIEEIINDMSDYNFEFVIPNESGSSQLLMRILQIFKIPFIILYFIMLIIYSIICISFFKNEVLNIKILQFVGFNKNHIFKILLIISQKLALNSFLIQLLCISIFFCIRGVINLFLKSKCLVIMLCVLLNTVLFFILSLILEKKLVSKKI